MIYDSTSLSTHQPCITNRLNLVYTWLEFTCCWLSNNIFINNHCLPLYSMDILLACAPGNQQLMLSIMHCNKQKPIHVLHFLQCSIDALLACNVVFLGCLFLLSIMDNQRISICSYNSFYCKGLQKLIVWSEGTNSNVWYHLSSRDLDIRVWNSWLGSY